MTSYLHKRLHRAVDGPGNCSGNCDFFSPRSCALNAHGCARTSSAMFPAQQAVSYGMVVSNPCQLHSSRNSLSFFFCYCCCYSLIQDLSLNTQVLLLRPISPSPYAPLSSSLLYHTSLPYLSSSLISLPPFLPLIIHI